MRSERRKPEASSLRKLFRDQWNHITGLIDTYQSDRDQARQRESIERVAVETVVDATNARLRLVSSYKNKLRGSVRGVLDHVEALVIQLPEPLSVSRERFLLDPLVNAFFVNKDAIRDQFSRSHDLQEFFADPLHGSLDRVWAVLFMVKIEKEVLGMGMEGGLITRDVKQTTISFTNHNVLQPRATEAEARLALERFLFESYVEYVNYRLVRLQADAEGMNLKNPAVYLQELVKILERPQELLRLETHVIRVNRIGIKVAADSKEVAHDLTLNEIVIGKNAREVVTLVTYPRDEMLPRDFMLRQAELRLGGLH